MQRPWPEYVPESSAAVGRNWDTFSLGDLRRGPAKQKPFQSSRRGHSPPRRPPVRFDRSIPRFPVRDAPRTPISEVARSL